MEIYIVSFIIVIFVIILILLFCHVVRFLKSYNKFINYLFMINDKDTLKKIGEIDPFFLSFFFKGDYDRIKALRKKCGETDDEHYHIFTEKYVNFIKKLYFFVIILFILVCVFISVWYD